MRAISALLFAAGLTAASTANAAFIDNGKGLIYDTLNNVTWTQDPNISGTTTFWVDQVVWASNLEYAGVKGWQLPDISVLANLYSELDGPPSSTDRTGDHGPFKNIQRFYWSDTLFVPTGPGQAPPNSEAYIWDFRDTGAFLDTIDGTSGIGSWVEVQGDVIPAPSPISLSLFVSGLASLGFMRWKRSTRNQMIVRT